MADLLHRPKVTARIDAALDKIPYDGTCGSGARIYQEVLATLTYGEYAVDDMVFDAINARIERRRAERGGWQNEKDPAETGPSS